MNTNQLRRFAKDARIKLLEQVGNKLEFVLTQDTAELRGKEKEVDELKQKIKQIGKEQVIEIVAYTWFNRLMALRFMDANDYTIPKVVTPLPGMTTPEISQNALGGNIDKELNLDRKRLNEILDGKSKVTDPHTEVYKLLLVASCNQWHTTMPSMFERINDYTELLLPDDLLSDYSIITDIRNGMSEEDCKQEELIGWLYQFYISDKKDEVFEKLKKNVKISPENIPAATQLFTPHWIVRYMVENTLGKLWLTLKPESKLRDFMPYYIESPDGNVPAPVPDDLTTNNEELPTKITFLDPCQGSGHVLVYAFDLFTKIYEEEGYNPNEIPELILKHNLFGIDIDERAAQLAAFALTMKARSYYSRFLRKPVQPNVIALENVSEEIIRRSVKLPINIKGRKLLNYPDLTLHLLTKADNFGSLIQIDPEEVELIKIEQGSIWQEQQEKFKEQAIYLSRQYHCVVTNPPYMGGKGMNANIKEFVEKNYNKSKSDLMACFIERCRDFNLKNGKIAMINQHSWMFLSSYEELRPYLIDNFQFESMLHLGPRTFPEIGGEVVQSTAFVLGKYQTINRGIYIRLIDFDNSQIKDDKTIEAIKNPNCGFYFIANQFDFEKIPSSPIGYWLSESTINKISNSKELSTYGTAMKGLDTCDNERFVRYWFEVSFEKFSNKLSKDRKWFIYQKGGNFKKWFGNIDKVVNWDNEGKEIRNFRNQDGSQKSRPQNISYYFKKGITWSAIGSKIISYRLLEDSIFGGGGNGFFPDEKNTLLFLGLLNSKISKFFLDLFNPTLNNLSGDLNRLPILDFGSQVEKINDIVYSNIEIAKHEINFVEVAWLFQQNNLIFEQSNTISDSFYKYSNYWSEKFYKLHRNEEELNGHFNEIYSLQNELSPTVPLEEITILQEEAKIVKNELFIDPIPVLIQLISYSIGSIFGRYSLDKPGLILANQGETLQDFVKQIPNPTFKPDEDNIIPVLEDEWFNDDIVGKFKTFLKAAFGEEHFEENLKFIEDTIGQDIRKYFVKDFYNDHIKRYKKRPIYWMFTSPKGSFKALIYMHRYQPDLCSKMLNDYLRAFIGKLEAKKQSETNLSLREDISAREKTAAIKEIDKLDVMLKDCREYEKTLYNIATQRINIDLDDGVKVNYQKFKAVLVPIKGLEKGEE